MAKSILALHEIMWEYILVASAVGAWLSVEFLFNFIKKWFKSRSTTDCPPMPKVKSPKEDNG